MVERPLDHLHALCARGGPQKLRREVAAQIVPAEPVFAQKTGFLPDLVPSTPQTVAGPWVPFAFDEAELARTNAVAMDSV